MTEDQVKAVFLLSGIHVKKLYKIENEYHKSYLHPWWLVQTDRGLIKIGWRRHVISINWEDLGIKFPLEGGEHATDEHVTQDDVTKSQYDIHAHSYGDAVNYLSSLRALFGRYDYLQNKKRKKQEADKDAGFTLCA